MRRSFFGLKIEPSCEYCQRGNLTADGKMVLCENKGVVAPFYSCRKFYYDPLKRIPKKIRKLPSFDKSDFEL